MDTTFTLEDIRDFLKRQFNFDWNYDVWDKKTGKQRKATLEDFDYSGRYSTTELAFFDKCGCVYNLEVHVSDFEFITYIDEPNIMGSGSTTYVHKNLSYSWIDYLLYRHNEEYAKKLFETSVINKKQIKNDMLEKIQTYTQELEDENRAELEYYEQLNEKAKRRLTVDEIKKIEQENTDEDALGE